MVIVIIKVNFEESYVPELIEFGKDCSEVVKKYNGKMISIEEKLK